MKPLTLALVMLTACSDSPERTRPDQTALDAAHATWSADPPPAYGFVWQRHCECTDATTRAMRITVNADAIASAIYVDDETPVAIEIVDRVLTVDEAFSAIQDALDRDAVAITAEYDAALGYPTSVYIDFDPQIADEELSFTIRELVPIASP